MPQSVTVQAALAVAKGYSQLRSLVAFFRQRNYTANAGFRHGVLSSEEHRYGSEHVHHQSYSHDLAKGRSALRKKATPSSATTVPASVCFEPGVRETLTHLIATRKLADACSKKPCSVVGIVDDAILNLVAKMKAKNPIGFIPVPAANCVRVSLRVGAEAHQVARTAARNANIRVSDIIRTGLTLYLRKHAKEIGKYSPTRRR